MCVLLIPHARVRLCNPRFGLPYRVRPALLGRLGRGRRYDIGADNSNVTSAVHALRAGFFLGGGSCASVDKPGVADAPFWPGVQASLRATGERAVLALERPLGV